MSGAGGSGARVELVFGVNPVLELLASRRGAAERVFVAREHAGRVGRILRMARQAGIPVTHLPRESLARKLGARAAHQGIAVQVAAVPYADVEALCRSAAERPAGLLVLVDRVEDAGNLGAILRTAAAAGAEGVILSREGTAGLTPHAAKASAGTLERIPVAREARPPQRVRRLREAGFRAVVLDPAGDTAWDAADLTGKLVVVAGGEARGARPGIVRACNVRVAIPLRRGVQSLNVAVALGVLLFEAVRQRGRSP